MRSGIIVASWFLSAAAVAQDGTWIGRAPGIPAASAPMTASSTHLYAFGGFGQTPGLQRSARRYDPVTDQWEDLAPVPADVIEGEAVFLNGACWLFSSGQVRRYDPGSGIWSPVLATFQSRWHLATTVLAGRVLLAGGYRAVFDPGTGTLVIQPSATCEWFDPVTNAVTPAPSMSAPRSGGWMGTHSGRAWYLGGSFFQGDQLACVAFDPAAGAWFDGPPLPLRSRPAGFSIGNLLYLVGGLDANDTTMATTLEFNPATGVTTPRASLVSGTGWAEMAGASQGDRGWLYGGTYLGNVTGALQRYSPGTVTSDAPGLAGLTPAAGATVQAGVPAFFSWTTSGPGATTGLTFDLEIAAEPTFASPARLRTTAWNLTWTPPGTGLHWWRVRATSSTNDLGPWSPVDTFVASPAPSVPGGSSSSSSGGTGLPNGCSKSASGGSSIPWLAGVLAALAGIRRGRSGR